MALTPTSAPTPAPAASVPVTFTTRLTITDQSIQLQVDRDASGVVTMRMIKPAKGSSAEVKVGGTLTGKELELLAAVIQGVRD